MVAKGTKRKGNYPAARYIYKDGDPKHRYERKACLECGEVALIRVGYAGFCSQKCSKMGDRNPAKQRKAEHDLTKSQYVRAHEIVRKVRGRATECINGCTGRSMYHWANISGDYWNPDDYQSMCVPCHDKFDRNR
jgi:hypothetical protein